LKVERPGNIEAKGGVAGRERRSGGFGDNTSKISALGSA